MLSLTDLVPRRDQKGNNSATGSALEKRRHEVVTFKPEELVPYSMPLKGKNNFLTKSFDKVRKHG